MVLSSCNKDVDNARINGKVMDAKTGTPIPNVDLSVENAFYEGGDGDGYGGYKNLRMTTDSTGKFTLRFPKSAYLQVTASKADYRTELVMTDIGASETDIVIKLTQK